MYNNLGEYTDKWLDDNELYDSIKYELNNKIYYYGNHFKYNYECTNTNDVFKYWIKNIIIDYECIKNGFYNLDNIIISNSYFSINDEIEKYGYNVFLPPWGYNKKGGNIGNINLRKIIKSINKSFQRNNYNELISDEFLKIINNYREVLERFLREKKVKAFFVPNDPSFFENSAIKVCKKIGIPTFVFLHGLPTRYNSIDDNRADYLLVWGEKIKQQYIHAGVPANKIQSLWTSKI